MVTCITDRHTDNRLIKLSALVSKRSDTWVSLLAQSVEGEGRYEERRKKREIWKNVFTQWGLKRVKSFSHHKRKRNLVLFEFKNLLDLLTDDSMTPNQQVYVKGATKPKLK